MTSNRTATHRLRVTSLETPREVQQMAVRGPGGRAAQLKASTAGCWAKEKRPAEIFDGMEKEKVKAELWSSQKGPGDAGHGQTACPGFISCRKHDPCL